VERAILPDICQIISQFGLKRIVTLEENGRLVFSVDLLHIRHAILLIRQTSNVPIGRMSLPLLHKDQIESLKITILLLIDTALDFLRRPFNSQFLPIEISLVPISPNLFDKINGADIEYMRDFILFERGAILLLLGVHVFMVKLVLRAIQQFEGLCAAGVHLSLDGIAG
jgi:hypothetical protein